MTRHGDYISDARAALGPQEADAAWEAGLAMDLEAAVARARADFGPPPQGARTVAASRDAAR